MPDDARGPERLIHDPDGGLPRLVAIMARLRDPEAGCPWDLEQTFDTIAPYTIEEAYEVADAIARRALPELRDELGDLLLQVVYHARMAEEAGAFDVADVVRAVSDKMVRRHPHVFGEESRDKTAEEQTADWERMKAAERAGARGARRGGGRAAGADAGGQAAGPGGAGGVRLARRGRGARQDCRGNCKSLSRRALPATRSGSPRSTAT